MKEIVVKNGTLNPVPIKELKQILPADGKFYTLPLEIALKYKDKLIPIKILEYKLPEVEPKVKGPIFKKESTPKSKIAKIKEKNAKPLKGKKVKKELRTKA